MRPAATYNLAIETTTRPGSITPGSITPGSVTPGSITLGRDTDILDTAALPQHRRHNVDLIPLIDQLTAKHNLSPHDLNEIYLSIGPGSFTGLRIAVATVRMLAMTLPNLRIVAVPTLNVIAQNAPTNIAHLAVCVNLKRQTFYTARFEQHDHRWQPTTDPTLLTLDQLLRDAPRPLSLIGPMLPDDITDDTVTLLPAALTNPQSDAAWHLGRHMAASQQFTDACDLLPLYVRPPEAVELWANRRKQAESKP